MENINNNGGGPMPNRLEDMINMEWLAQNHAQQQEINARLMQGIAAIQASLQTPGSSENTVPSVQEPVRVVSEGSRRPKHVLAHPNKFDGQDRSAYKSFKGYLKVKFRIDSEAIGGETEKVWYGYGHLVDKAAQRIFPWLASTEERGRTLRVDDFFAQMDAAFDDPQSKGRALEWINEEKQGSRPLQDYLHDFEQKLLEAGGWEFSDGVRKGYLRAAISRRIKEKLVAAEEPAKYEDFVNQIRMTSDNLAELDRLGSRKEPWVKPYNDTDKGNSMDWEPTPQVSYGSATSRPRNDKAQAKWVSKEVLEQRRANQECLRCGGADHFISKCRLSPATRPGNRDSKPKRPAQVAATSESTPKPARKTKRKEAVVEELSSDSESDSGNE